MATFFIRVQLFQRQEDHPDYDLLHHKLEDAGFTEYTLDSQGKTRILPHAMYVIEDRGPSSAIRDKVKSIASEVWRDNAIVVVEARRWSYSNLKFASRAHHQWRSLLRFVHSYEALVA